jgi:hypothetical protein
VLSYDLEEERGRRQRQHEGRGDEVARMQGRGSGRLKATEEGRGMDEE